MSRRQRIQEVPNIPQVDDKAWNLTLTQVQQPFTRLGKFDDAIETQILSLQGNWCIILHWIIRKKWRKKHKIPGDRARNKDFEPLGELYYRILQLCIEVHPFDPGGYASAADWFRRIITSERDDAYKLIFAVACRARKPPTKTDVASEFARKAVALKRFRYPFDVREFANPYCPVEEPHMNKLIASAVRIAETEDLFRDNYWTPFVDATDTWAREFTKPAWNVQYALNGKLFRTSSRGRNKGVAMPLPSAEFLRDCRQREGH